MGNIYYCSVPCRVVHFIIHILWMVAHLASVTEDGLWNINTRSVLMMLSHVVTTEGNNQVTGTEISAV